MRPIALLLLAIAAAAHGQATLIDQLFERHVRVKSAVGPGVLHLLYERKADPQAPPSSCYRRLVAGAGWLTEEQLHGGHRCAAFLADTLYVFRRAGYSVYRTTNWKAQAVFATAGPPAKHESEWETRAWPLGWPPATACAMGGELWVFGVEASEGGERIRAAAIAPGAKEAPGSGPRLLGNPLTTPARPSDLSVLADGKAALVFWHQPAAGREGNELWHASFDGAGWGPARSVPLPYPNSDYAVARHEGATWLVCKARGQRIKESRPLLVMTLADGKWGEPAPVPGAVDSLWLDWTLDIDAASFDGSLLVFRACMDRVVAHRWSGGTWREPEVPLELSPWPTYLFWWLLANIAASLVLLPVVGWAALRVRTRPRPRVHAFGTQVCAATWARRVAAQLVDILVGLLLCSGVLRWLETSDAEAAAPGAEGILATVALCSSVLFGYFVLSEGLTGQSFGKLLLRIVVVGRDGRRPSVGSILMRNALRPWPFLVPTAYLVGSLILLLTPANQRLGDLLAGTLVVDMPPPAAASPWPAGDG
ncbi:MAG TPA: RDD family protein [Planctomycetota bacterium]|nr:RDD family protein [Planctomycetota bacterium]